MHIFYSQLLLYSGKLDVSMYTSTTLNIKKQTTFAANTKLS